MGTVNLCDPVEAYVRPIRSVLFIDDQFPTFGQSAPNEASEAERARALWQACTERGWLCDVDNSSDWTSNQRKQRLASCDLLVLDYHLSKNDNGPALAIIQGLARSESPNLVVLYTADSKLDQVLISAAASARGATLSGVERELEPEIEEMDIEWSVADLVSFIEGKQRWIETYKSECKKVGQSFNRSIGEALLERWLTKKLGVAYHEKPLRIEKIRCTDKRWFQCGNLFVVVVGKPIEQVPEEEARVVLGGLEAAIQDWAPPWLACLVASSRRNVEIGSFRDDVDLPPESLHAGLLRYIRASADNDERARRAREVMDRMLARRFDLAARTMADPLLRRAETESPPLLSPQADRLELLHVNAFLCSEPFSRHHLRIGTIFRSEDEYWACVTPACDMVPRDRSESIDPWAVELDPIRPMLALRLDIRRKDESTSRALAEAEQGRFLFLWDTTKKKDSLIVAACFNPATGDPNPRLEQMFALDRARVHDGKVLLQRCTRDPQGTTVEIKSLECDVVCQLRAPYAERLAHVVGYHLSRIGVNFLRLNAQTPENQDLLR